MAADSSPQGESASSVQLAELRALGARENLADFAYGAIREAITDGTLRPGFRLREIALSQQIGVSTTPVREALRRLEREGLVKINPRRGALVRLLDEDEARELYDLRELLEAYALGRAAERTDIDLSRAVELLTAARATIDEPAQIKFNRLDVEFHHALTVLGGNREVAELAKRVHRRIQGIRVRSSIQLQGRPARSHAEHEEIVAAIRRHDPAAAERLIRAHITGVRDAVLAMLHRAAPADSE